MNFFRRRIYQSYRSEFTLFLENLKVINPNLEEEQRQGRALLWDKEPMTLDRHRRTQESSIKQQAYVYQTKWFTDKLVQTGKFKKK